MHPRRYSVLLFAVRQTKLYNARVSTRGADYLIVQYEIDLQVTITQDIRTMNCIEVLGRCGLADAMFTPRTR